MSVDPRLLEALGVPYSWGGGSAATRWPGGGAGIIPLPGQGAIGWDCSGFAQAALCRLGMLGLSAPDKTAADLYNSCDVVSKGHQRLGDLAFYSNNGDSSGIIHVVVVGEDAREDGDSSIIGANGGSSTTNGDLPSAKVRAEGSIYYWDKFYALGRIKQSQSYVTQGDILQVAILNVVGSSTVAGLGIATVEALLVPFVGAETFAEWRASVRSRWSNFEG